MAVKKRKSKSVSKRKAPSKKTAFPKGKFVKVKAIKVNRNGTITVKK